MLGILSILVGTSQPEMMTTILSSFQIRVGFDGVQQGSLFVLEYEIRFLK